MSLSTLLVTVHGPLKTIDLELPGDVPIGELLPLLLEICGPQQNNPTKVLQTPVRLQVVGMRTPLSSDKTLIEANVYDGAVLELQTNHSPSTRPRMESLAPRPFVPKSVQPSKNTGGIGITWEGLG